jgi:hypothetical protein
MKRARRSRNDTNDLPVFDWDRWLPVLAQPDAGDSIVSSTGPDFLCRAEWMRRAGRKISGLGNELACDVFVLGLGEPKRRDVTKVGGLPYRPADRPWPRSSKTGEELSFVCQFRVTESRDLLGETPGDILLVFSEWSGRCWAAEEGDPPYCEWVWMDVKEEDLVRPQDIPQPRLAVPVCYTERCRYSDLVDEFAIDVLKQVWPLPEEPDWDENWDRWNFSTRGELREGLCQLNVLKLGGTPFWSTPYIHLAQGTPGRFMASIPWIMDGAFCRYPWLNGRRKRAACELMWHPEATLHLYLDESGVVMPLFAMRHMR